MPVLYFMKFAEVHDCFAYADSPELALAMLRAEGVEETPEAIAEVPAGCFSAEIRIEGDGEEEDDPAAATSDGVCLDPFETLVAYIEGEANMSRVAAAAAVGTATTQPAPPEESEGT